RARVALRELQIDDVFVNLILVAPERHAHFIEPDVAAQRFHLIDRSHVELLGLIDGPTKLLLATECVVALIGNPWRVVTLDLIESLLRLLKSRGRLCQLQPALSGKNTRVRGARGRLSSLEDFSRTLRQFLSCLKLLLPGQKLLAPLVDNADAHIVAFID